MFASPSDMNINPFGGTKMESPITSATDGNGSLLSLLIIGIQWLYTVFFILAVAMILLAAYNFVRGGNNEKLVETAKKQLKWAVVAIAIALVSAGITLIVKDFITGGSSGQQQNQQLPKFPTT